MALRTFVEPGEEVIISDPTFLVYKIASKTVGADIIVVPTKDYKYDLESILDKITNKTKMIFIANPENPTGTHIDTTSYKSFMDKVPKNVIVFSDEAYYEFARGIDYPETIGMLNEYPNLIVSRTFSKAYGLAGLRIGYGLASKEIINAMNKVREPFNINSLAQVAAIVALEDEKYVEVLVKAINEGKKELYKVFDELGVKYIKSSTNFILIKVPGKADKIVNFLLKQGVIVRDMTGWGLEGYFRMNVGTKEENRIFIEKFTEAIK